MNKILIVVDMQNDFITGSLGTSEARAIVPNVVSKLENISKETFVIFTKDTHTENYPNTQEGRHLPIAHCMENTAGSDICDELKQFAKSRYVFSKSTFGITELVSVIQKFIADNEILEIELIGLCTDICVIINTLMLKAYFPEMSFVVDSACCAGVTPENHEAALTVLRSCQVKVLEEFPVMC